MKRLLTLGVVLMGAALALSFANSGNTPITSPQIVASGAMLNQSATFENVIFTPASSGLYRISAYATVTKADPTSESQWYYGLVYTDAAQGENASPILTGNAYSLGSFWTGINSFSTGGVTITI